MNSMNVVFSNPTGPTCTIGPFRQIYISGRELREFQKGPVLAEDDDFRWVVNGARYSRFDCDVECNVTLARDRDNASKTYGPFPSFSSLNGLKFVNHQMFCLYDEANQDWYGYQSGEHWDHLTVIPT